MTRTLNLAMAALLLASLPAQAKYAKLFDGGFGEFNPGNLPSIIPPIGEGQEVGTQDIGAEAQGVEDLSLRLQQSNPEIPAAAVQKLFKHLQENPARNSNYATIIDMDKPSDQKRMYVINLRTGQVDKYLVAHGAGSGRGDMAEDFSDRPRSHQTSLGIYITGSEYDGKHGRSLKLDGQESSNDNAESRSVVLHGADYVSDEYARRNGRVGNSWGCPAVDHRYRDEIIDKIGNGSVMLIYAS